MAHDHEDKKVLVNGEEVTPGKKIKLQEHLSKAEIDALIESKLKHRTSSTLS
jgi:hypothetical protein